MKLLILLTFVIFPHFYGQTYPALEAVLKKEFSENSMKDGRWVYYPDKANIEKIEKPLMKGILPNHNIYKVTLTNYLGYHVNQATCIILFDSLKAKTTLVEPIWFSGISHPFIKLFLRKEFDSKEKLLSSLTEIHNIMEIGSGYRFVNTSSTDNLLRYDLVYFKGDSYTTGGNGTSSTTTYTKDGIYRQIEIKLKGYSIKEYTSINPKLKDKKEYKDSYKEVIK